MPRQGSEPEDHRSDLRRNDRSQTGHQHEGREEPRRSRAFEQVADDGSGDHDAGSTADPLEEAETVEHEHRRSRTAGHGRDDEENKPEEEGPPPPFAVADGPDDQLADGNADEAPVTESWTADVLAWRSTLMRGSAGRYMSMHNGPKIVNPPTMSTSRHPRGTCVGATRCPACSECSSPRSLSSRSPPLARFVMLVMWEGSWREGPGHTGDRERKWTLMAVGRTGMGAQVPRATSPLPEDIFACPATVTPSIEMSGSPLAAEAKV